MSEIIVRYKDGNDHMAVRGGEYVRDYPHGEWVKRTHDTLIAQVNFAYCSECGQPIMHEHTRPLWNFCPNCGARMKGADDETKQIV